MWNYIKLHGNISPMAEILSDCSDKVNLRLVIYNLSENHVECATVSPSEVREFDLGNTAREIRGDARNGNHAVLAYDMGRREVYLVDSTPELPVASAVLLCVVTELLNGCVQSRECQCGRPEVCRNAPRPSIEEVAENNYRALNAEFARRDARGRFVRRTEAAFEEPCKEIPQTDSADAVIGRRFRLGRH